MNNAPRQIQILSADHHALIGLALLQNHQLNAEVGALFAKRQKKEDCHSRAGGNPENDGRLLFLIYLLTLRGGAVIGPRAASLLDPSP